LTEGEGHEWHLGLYDPKIHVSAFGGVSRDLVDCVTLAEVSEMFMTYQDIGSDPMYSNAEGLSRVLATNSYPVANPAGFLELYQTGASWLDSQRPDYVTNTEETDIDPIATGCSPLFISYLRFQLDFSLKSIIRAGAPTLAQTYSRLTGRDDAFAYFSSILEHCFPVGTKSNLLGDNPFPVLQGLAVCGVSGGAAFLTYRGVDNWTGWLGIWYGTATVVAVDCIGVGRGLSVCAVDTNGRILGCSSSCLGLFVTVGCARIDGELQVCGITDDGVMWYTVQHVDGFLESAVPERQRGYGRCAFPEPRSLHGSRMWKLRRWSTPRLRRDG
jgi:hypothetical protein